tara:strand:+ start:1922 stop:2044 length:123 start_codon:yes stop_codon:yes gene_type:complete
MIQSELLIATITFSEDANILASKIGYTLITAGIIDMFPHT